MMKSHSFLWACIIFLLTAMSPLVKNAAAVTDANTTKVLLSEVKAGTRKEANASWWGFDKEDATACLQAAINSGVPKLIVDNTGSDWIVNQPITLASHQEIVFADGVVVKAKKDCFKAIGDCLFRGSNLQNITLRGAGKAVLQMNKKDYQDATKYKPGEWRHGINLAGCTNVVIRDLTIKETGGDGIYIGAGTQPHCENVLIENVISDGNNRLGMAVTSAQNLTVRHCQFINALGASPQGGIDFEPNSAKERLVNCVVEDCTFANNIKGAGASVSPNHLSSQSLPVSVTFKNCTFNDNALGIFLYPTRRSSDEPSIGQVEFDDCRSNNPVLFQDPVTKGIKFIFKNCTIDNRKNKNEALAIICKEAAGRAIGNIVFDNTTVIDDLARDPIAIKYQGNGDVSDAITGTLYVKRNNQISQFDLSAFIKREQAEFSTINAQKPAVLHLDDLKPPPSDAPRQGNSEVYLRGSFTFLQYAEKGQSITIDARAVKVGTYSGNTDLTLLGPDDAVIKTYSLPPDSEIYPITFTAATTGFYRVTCAGTVQRVDITSPHRGNGILLDGFQTFLPIQGKLYFQVPAGVREFYVGIAADAGADVALVDPNGKEIERHQNIDSMQLFSATRAEASHSEIWSIDVSKVVWQLTVRLYAPLEPIVSTNPDTLVLTSSTHP
jgi:hypothetical protein